MLAELTDLWMDVADAVLEKVPPFAGGYVTRMNMWAPGKALTAQNDVSTLISPRAYDQFVRGHDRRIFGRFPFVDYHMHSTQRHHAAGQAALEELTAIQLSLEHTFGGPPLETMLPVARRILESKPLLLTGFDCATADRCMAEFPSAGLCMLIALSGDEIPADVERWLARRGA